MSKFLQYLIIFGIAMVPIVELRGALPVAYGFFYDAAHPFTSVIWSYLIIAIGNMVPVPFIFFFARRFLEWGKDKKVIGGFCRWCLKKGEKGGQKLQAKAGRGSRCRALELGQEPWLRVSSTWTSKRASSPSSVASCWPASS